MKKLEKHYTVYTIDLLGCGRSDKPYLTYTNYLYVQLLTDFIHDVIGERPDVVTTGNSIFVCGTCPEYESESSRKHHCDQSACDEQF